MLYVIANFKLLSRSNSWESIHQPCPAVRTRSYTSGNSGLILPMGAIVLYGRDRLAAADSKCVGMKNKWDRGTAFTIVLAGGGGSHP